MGTPTDVPVPRKVKVRGRAIYPDYSEGGAEPTRSRFGEPRGPPPRAPPPPGGLRPAARRLPLSGPPRAAGEPLVLGGVPDEDLGLVAADGAEVDEQDQVAQG